jgi:hypothetical protein
VGTTDSNGILWVYKLDKNGTTVIQKKGIDTSSESGYTLAENANGNLYIITPVSQQVAMIKTDSLGNFVWKKYFPNYNEGPLQIQKTGDNNLVICFRQWVEKIDLDGNIIWSQNFQNGAGGGINKLLPLSDGSIIAAGSAYLKVQTSYVDGWIFKINKSGDILWSKSFGGDNQDNAHAIIQRPNGDLIVIATSDSYGKAGDYLWLFRTDADGNFIPIK